MPYKKPEKTAEAMRKYRERKAAKDKALTAKEKALKEQLEKYSIPELQVLKNALLRSPGELSADLVQNTHAEIKEVVAEFRSWLMKPEITRNKHVFSVIDFIFGAYIKMMEIIEPDRPEQKQAWLDSAKNIKEAILTDQQNVYVLGKENERINKKINQLEDKKTNE